MQHSKNRKPGVFDLLTLGKFSLYVPLTQYALNRHGYSHVLSRLPTRRLKRWLPSLRSDKRILNACKYALGMIERYSPFPGTCLSRSLILWSRLQRYGIAADLRIGIKTTMDSGTRKLSPFAAHAWVEVNGIPFNAPGDIATRYIPFNRDITNQNIDEFPFTSRSITSSE